MGAIATSTEVIDAESAAKVKELRPENVLVDAVAVAYALTPGLGSIVGDTQVEIGGNLIQFNRFTAPGFLLVAINVFTIVFNNLIYDDSISRDDAPESPTLSSTAVLPHRTRELAPPTLSDRAVTVGMLVFIFLNFIARGILSIFETVNVPLFLEMTNRMTAAEQVSVEATQDASRFYLVVGLLGLISYGSVQILHKKVSVVSFLLFGFSMLLVGNAILLTLCADMHVNSERSDDTDEDHPQQQFNIFVAAEVFVWSVGCPLTSAVVVSAFSEVLGSRPQGFLMGVFGASASCLLVCDIEKCCVHAYAASFSPDATGDVKMILNQNNPAGTIGSRGSAPGQFNYPVAVAVNLRGEIAVADGKQNRVQIFSGSGDLEYSFGRPGSTRGEFKGISDLKFTSRGHLAIVDSGNHRIQVMSATGNVVQVIGRYGWKLGQFINPCALTINGKGEYFVCDEGNKRIQRLSDRGRPLLEWGCRRGPTPELETVTILATNDEIRPAIYSVFDAPCDVVVGIHGEIIVCDAGRRELLVFSDVGVCLHVVNAPHILQTNSPTAMAICSNMLVTIATPLSDKNVQAQLKLEGTGDVYNCLLPLFLPRNECELDASSRFLCTMPLKLCLT
ncbi:Major facilitator superfamily domain [Phytophthora cactorum]|nr:Major facilitator superfamily domain [Phytophthora cactorum]